jgi:amino acid adenylation domain-containing protein
VFYTVPDLLLNRASQRGVALIDGSESVTYQELAARSRRCAGRLAEGRTPGTRIALLIPRSATALAAYFGTQLAGLIPVIMHDQLRPRQIAHIVTHAETALVVASKRLRPLLRDCDPAIPVLDPDDLLGPPLAHPVRVIDRDLAGLIYTSGSTGSPKGVMVSHHNLVSGALIVADYLRLTDHDRTLALLPWSFDYGLNQVLAIFAAGGTVVIQRSSFAPDICRTLIAAGVTGLAGVPSLWTALTGPGSPFLHERYPTLRYLTNSGGALPDTVIKSVQDAHPGVSIYSMYGLTEAFRSTFLDPAQVGRKPRSVGKPIPNSDVQVVDEDGESCPPGVHGEVIHRGPTVAIGYWRDPASSARVFRPHPRLAAPQQETVVYSGDIGYTDADGDLYIAGRRDEMAKIRGVRITPTEIEAEIMASGMVSSAVAVIVTPDDCEPGIEPDAEPLVLLGIQPREGFTTEDFEAFCRVELPAHMRPRRITLIEPMPTNPHGKIDRRLVCQRLVLAASLREARR